MTRYKITYSNGKRDINVIRKAETAVDAVEALCDQYKWRFKVSMFDADTRGTEWAVCFADTDGGINYHLRIEAKAVNG